ncbi:proline racemase family protein [Desulforhopalus vacuolatus]|uniref:proline racemase family protein n=1 Tax=Desulforhopalus vacuolatus TaxID=40414 RepID=UPI0019627B83|nr:proline racemase family protein [Desulforhopalus vacuolatus]MBM9518199.1 proline racemase family protein [Desulforhopalus vacuolatus]
MEFSRMITTVDSHTAGEPTRVVTGGIPHIPGETMAAKKKWLQENLDHLRKTLMWEPRGHQDMFGAVLTSPTSADADIGVIFMDGGGYLDMCGHGSIGAVTALVETGMVEIPSPENNVISLVLDTPAGKVKAKVQTENSKVKAVTIRNVPAFLYKTIQLKLSDIGEITVHISYGGNFFALVKASDLQIALQVENIKHLQSRGMEIREKINREHVILHPATGEKAEVDLVEIYEEGLQPKNVVIFGAGQVDRSPCGTGTCAKMALLHEKGHLKLNQPYVYSSLFNTTFTGRLIEESTAGELRAVIPEIEGRAFITGIHQFVIDREDPLGHGFSFSAQHPDE